MADSKLTRQQIYDRIRQTSRDEFMLEEMKRLGFWDKNDAKPGIPETIIKQEAALQQELNALMAQKNKYLQREAALKEMRTKRMAEAREKREARKKLREQQRQEKAAAWSRKKETEIIYLGEGVSTALAYTDNNTPLLRQHNLPVFGSEPELAAAMGIALQELRFMAFQRKVSEVSHYKKFRLPKKSGGTRLISAPMPRLKKVQHWILENMLNKVALHEAANGFVTGRSILTNARPHVGKDLVVNIDIKDFFPGITFKRVKGLLQQLGYSGRIATVLALLCTEAPTAEVETDGKTYHVQKGDRLLPQGAPTSPAITNILCFRLDKRLEGLAAKLQLTYTRYADDITFSGSGETDASQLLWRIKKILQDEGFVIHADKVRIMRKAHRQEVTGIVVNQQPGISRDKLRRFRSLLHHAGTSFANLSAADREHLTCHITGYVNFIRMVSPAKAQAFQQTIDQLFATGILTRSAGSIPLVNTAPEAPPLPGDAAPDDDPDKPWWKVV